MDEEQEKMERTTEAEDFTSSCTRASETHKLNVEHHLCIMCNLYQSFDSFRHYRSIISPQSEDDATSYVLDWRLD